MLPAQRRQASKSITVASCYFGNYHSGDPRKVRNKGVNGMKYLEAVRDVFGAKPH